MKLPKSFLLPAAVSLAACRAASLAVKASRSASAVSGSRPNAHQSHAWICPSTGSWARTVRSTAVAWQLHVSHVSFSSEREARLSASCRYRQALA
eukprot:694778-Pleurochrysis_carterae.AAC.5